MATISDASSLLAQWNARYDARRKMQHVYLVIIVASIFVAGLLSLVNRDLGFFTLRITLLASVVFLINAVTWSLLHTGLLHRLLEDDTQSQPNRSARKR